MANPVLDLVEERAEEIASLGADNEKAGKLTDRAAELLRETGVIRMFQPKKYGGAEAHPADFAETVMRIASLDGSTGWVAGIVGVHPWEMAMCDAATQEAIWGEDNDTWIASPTPRWASSSRSTAATSSTAAGASRRAPTTVTGSSWAPCSVTLRATWSSRRRAST
ncbi:hypothetical protein [Nocardioides alcanivorans]|uniref:hypothetical protein n=1 Tax=Nocardioides alcanivorans TaxID=2897352 RepID=UPI001F16D506|nr:hypothetical protein [Nocardioides alcanivorans]